VRKHQLQAAAAADGASGEINPRRSGTKMISRRGQARGETTKGRHAILVLFREVLVQLASRNVASKRVVQRRDGEGMSFREKEGYRRGCATIMRRVEEETTWKWGLSCWTGREGSSVWAPSYLQAEDKKKSGDHCH